MNVLVLYQSPWWSAAAYYSYNLVKALAENNHKVIFVGSKDSPAAKKISELEVQINNLNLFVSSPLRFITIIRKIKKLIIDEKIDLMLAGKITGRVVVNLDE